jgi:hypothetical protein
MVKLICTLIVLITMLTGQVKAEELDAARILQEVKQNGPRSVINRFYGESLQKAEPLEDSISTGKKEWLEIAKLLRSESDAVVSELLN